MRHLTIACLLSAVTAISAHAFEKAAEAWKLPWDADWVTAVCFLGENRVAAGNNLGQILVWDLPEKGAAAPLPIRRLDSHTNTITRLVASPDGRWLISASNDHTICYWDMQAPGKGSDTITLNAVARDEAVRRKSSKVPPPIPAKVELHQPARVLGGHKDWVLGLALTPDGKSLVSGDDKGTVIFWERESATELRRMQLKGWVWALAITPDAQSLIVSERVHLVFDSGRYSALKLWHAQTGELKADLTKDVEKQMIGAAAFSPDGKWLAVGRGGETDTQGGKVTLLDAGTGKKVRELTPGHQYGVTDLAFHPDGKHLLSSGRDTLVRVWRLPEGKLVKELGQSRGGQFKDWIHAMSISPSGQRIAGADMAGLVHIWEVNP